MLEYQILNTLSQQELYKLNEEQTREYFDWYIAQCPIRSAYVFKMAGYEDDSFQNIAYTPESLITIWEWFLSVANVEDCPENTERPIATRFAKRLAMLTEYIIRDIGMYLGETWVHNYTTLYWNFHTKPKKDLFQNSPIIDGFLNKAYSPPFACYFEPIHMAGIQARKILQGKQRINDLYDLYTLWAKKVP